MTTWKEAIGSLWIVKMFNKIKHKPITNEEPPSLIDKLELEVNKNG